MPSVTQMLWQPSELLVAGGREQWKEEGKAKARALRSHPLVDSASSGSWDSRAGLGLRVEATEAWSGGRCDSDTCPHDYVCAHSHLDKTHTKACIDMNTQNEPLHKQGHIDITHTHTPMRLCSLTHI